jgi:hypothetical protein
VSFRGTAIAALRMTLISQVSIERVRVKNPMAIDHEILTVPTEDSLPTKIGTGAEAKSSQP